LNKKQGRPKIKIDWKEFDKLCELQCTKKEIASCFDCTPNTIVNRVKQEKGMTFLEYYGQKSAKGKISLRRLQWQTAEKGNVVMQIFLGKQYLGQRDKMEGSVAPETLSAMFEKIEGKTRENDNE